LFAITYPETEEVFGLKFSIVWRAAFATLVVVLLATRLATDRLQVTFPHSLRIAYLWFCCAPLFALTTADEPAIDLFSAFAVRVFPVLAVLAFASGQGVRIADLVLRLFPWFLVLVAPLFILGVLEPRGIVTSLKFITGADVDAFNSVFQTVHSAGFAHAIGALIAFALVHHAGPRRAWPYLVLGVFCIGLAAMTTARAGLLAALAALPIIWIAKRNFSVPAASFFLIVALCLGVFATRPDLIEVGVGRLRNENQWAKASTVDALTSGRLGLQEAALSGYAAASKPQQLFGMGRGETIREIDRRTGYELFPHSAFVDELTRCGLFGLISLLAVFATAYQHAWASMKRGMPLSLALITATLVVGIFQSVEYSLQLALMALVILLESRLLARHAPQQVTRPTSTKQALTT
jgi:hypothetical protein